MTLAGIIGAGFAWLLLAFLTALKVTKTRPAFISAVRLALLIRGCPLISIQRS